MNETDCARRLALAVLERAVLDARTSSALEGERLRAMHAQRWLCHGTPHPWLRFWCEVAQVDIGRLRQALRRRRQER